MLSLGFIEKHESYTENEFVLSQYSENGGDISWYRILMAKHTQHATCFTQETVSAQKTSFLTL